jgi:very-short-patch-repair endonuclease
MNLYIIAGIVIALVIVLLVFKAVFEGGDNDEKEKPKYRYTRKQFFLTRAEHECYDALVAAVGDKYHIFAQVHLPTILDNKVKGQDWRAALAHINRKSVDFVLCDKAYISPKLAIELDDKSHERPDRQERDKEVECILADAGVPLLRLENKGHFDPQELAQRINEYEQRNQIPPANRQ